MRAALLAALTAALTAAAPVSAEAPAIPRFTEETRGSGLDHRYTGDWTFMVGGGVATFDCDGDGLPDMALAGGAAAMSLWRNASAPGGPLRFSRAASGVEIDGVTGAWPLDVDGDGLTDLALTRVGESLLMRGLGGCRFERATEAWGFHGGDAWATAFSATWERGAQWPTLAVGTYIDRREEGFPWGSCTDNSLHRPDPGGARAFAPPLALEPGHCALSMLFTDWARTGTPGLRVSNDREYYKGGQEQLWRIEPGRPPALWTETEGWRRLRVWGMGIASHDVTGDGYPDYFLTSMADNKLQALAAVPADGSPAPSFDDIAFARGVTAHRPHTGGDIRPSTAWHAQFEDVNNDGRADLFIAKGNVDEMPDFAQADPDNLLLQGADGRFLEAAAEAGVASTDIARGAALADFNLDGRLDLVVVSRRTPVRLWRNDGPAGGAVQVRLSQPGPNRDAVGAWVELRRGAAVTRREITVGGGHASGQSGWVHFGMGDAATAEIRVLWPHGAADPWRTVAAGGFYVLAPGRDPSAWRPPTPAP